MRKAAVDELNELAKADSRIMLLTADLGFGVLDDFQKELPQQFVNVGVAEQCMIGIATGLAEGGFLPYCYSIATFAFLRPFEFIRNGPVAHGLPVRIIGVGAGTDYSYDGLTHFALEDLALARSQPGLTVFAPATDDDAKMLVREAYALPGPVYFRLSRQGTQTPSQDVRTEQPEDTDVVVFALGTAQSRAIRIAQGISDAGLSARVLSVLRFDERTNEDLAAHLSRARMCVVSEDHYVVGGLGSAVAELIATRALSKPLAMDGVNKLPIGDVGSPQFMESKLHQPVEQLVSDVVARLRSN